MSPSASSADVKFTSLSDSETNCGIILGTSTRSPAAKRSPAMRAARAGPPPRIPRLRLVAETRRSGELHITVCAMSADLAALDLSLELRLTKAALLYADRVSLAGPKVQMLSHLDRFRSASASEQEAMIRRAMQVLPEGPEALASLDRLTRARGGFVAARARQARETVFTQARAAITEKMGEMLDEAAYQEFTQAIGAGVLVLDPLFGGTGTRVSETGAFLADAVRGAATTQGMQTHGVAREWSAEFRDRLTDLLLRLLDPGAGSEALFDDTTGDLAGTLLHMVGGSARSVPREPALASELIGTVPAYAQAPMKEILDARRALREPLIRFRAAVATFSQQVSAIPPGPEFRREAAELYRREVAPRLLELEEVQREMRLDRQLTRHTLASGNAAVAGVIAFAAVNWMDADTVIRAVTAATPVAAKVAHDIIEERRELSGRKRENRMLFLYELARRFPRAT